jgi:hypothetical protein
MRRGFLGLSLFTFAGVAAAGLVGWQIGRHDARDMTTPEQITTRQLGERLMARVGKRFVADNRHGAPIAGGSVTFYDQAQPYGESFCWTTSYILPPAIVDDRAAARGEPLEGNVAVERVYGVWKAPTSPNQSEQAAQKACAAYRDFDHMFREANADAGTRGAYLLDAVMAQARNGRLDFPARCSDEDKPLGCDMIALLKRLTLKQMSYAETKARKDSAHSSIYTDELTLWTGRNKGRESVVLTITSEQPDTHYSSNDAVRILNQPIVVPPPHLVSADAVVSSLD